jgi:hypothetical protein
VDDDNIPVTDRNRVSRFSAGRRRLATGVVAVGLALGGVAGGFVVAHAATTATPTPSTSTTPATTPGGTATPAHCPGM